MKEFLKHSALVVVVALLAACDKVPLLAPVSSTITLSANASTVPTGGTVGLTAFVTESSGTPVQNGTTVRFTTTLGAVAPAETQTTNGLAVAQFQAGTASGVAEVHAVSGGATGTTAGTGATATTTNVVKITIGAAAVNGVSVSANPSSVSPNGGSAQVTAFVVDANGGSLAGIPVTFGTDQGFVNPGTVISDSGGLATTTLTTSADATVTAAAGTKTATVKVVVRAGPTVSVACTVPGGGNNSSCGSVAANDSTNTATVSFTITKPTTSSAMRDVTIDFGDRTSQSLGTLASGTATVLHSYAGPSGGAPATYIAVVRAVDINGETTSVSTTVNVTPRGPLTVDLAATQGDSVRGEGQPVSFTATVTGGTAQSFAWDFDGDGNVDATTTSNKTTHIYESNGRKTAIVTVRTTDDRTGSARTEFIVTGTNP